MSHIGKCVVTVSSPAAWTMSLHGDVHYLTTSAGKFIIIGCGAWAVCAAGPHQGVLPGDCDERIQHEPAATDCTRTGGSIKVLTNRKMAVVMLTPFLEASPAEKDAHEYSGAIGRALGGCRAGSNAFDSSRCARWVHLQLSAHDYAPPGCGSAAIAEPRGLPGDPDWARQS